MNLDKSDTEGLLENAWSSVKHALLDQLMRGGKDASTILNIEENESKSGGNVLTEVIVDKLRQSLKRDLDGNIVKDSNPSRSIKNNGNQTVSDDASTTTTHKSKRKPSVKYNGLSELELSKRHLPDHLVLNLDILIVGLNPSLQSVFKGHHYAGPGHHFWKCIHTSGLVPHAMNACEDYRLPQFGVGFTNVVPRATKSASDLTKEEIQEGRIVLIQKIKLYKPRIVVLVGKGVFDIFYSSSNFCYGKQPLKFPETDSYVFVIPSATGCGSSYWPRVQDKLPFFQALRKLRDYVKGNLPTLREEEVIFPISSSSNSSHNGGASTPNTANRRPITDNRNDHSSTVAVLSPCSSVESRGGPMSPHAKNNNVCAAGQDGSITGSNELISSTNVSPVGSTTNGQAIKPLSASPHLFWSEFPPAANSTTIGHAKLKQSQDDHSFLSCNGTISSNLSSSVIEQFDDSSGYASMNATKYTGPVVFHHSSDVHPTTELDSSSIQQMLIFGPPPLDQQYVKHIGDFSANWPETDSNWSLLNQEEYGDEYADGDMQQHFSANASLADCAQRNDSNKVLFEWYPANCSRADYCSQSSVTDASEFTKLYFLDDDISNSSAEPVIRQLIPASEL